MFTKLTELERQNLYKVVNKSKSIKDLTDKELSDILNDRVINGYVLSSLGIQTERNGDGKHTDTP